MEAAAPQQLSFEGRISIDNSNAMRNRLGKALNLKPKEIDVDLSRVTSIDISGLATLLEATRIARDQWTRLRIGGIQGQVQLLFAITHLSNARHNGGAAKDMNVFEDIGGAVVQNFAYVGGLSDQFWSGIRALPRVLPIIGKRGRWQAAIRQMAAIGVAALPMIAIMAASTGMILALQGAAELRRFGALRYVIDLVAVGV